MAGRKSRKFPLPGANIAGNKYRLITAIHYNRQLAFTLMVLTHAEYAKGKWKDVL
ncbi:MAG: type II toxin-antitoxin system HigB family toxin [Planctomycetaceae bacterium]|nr:type II toxin-antitoxin system HigB family toxin [Planctomycetaceae bacterium]